MNSKTENKSVLLVRAAPSARARRELTAAIGRLGADRRAVTVFFHGQGVGFACLGDLAVSLEVSGGPGTPKAGDQRLILCSSSWQRRHTDQPPQGFMLGSLALFWSEVTMADQVECLGYADG